ncbi:hypothetical protein GGR57DRAFT_513143 [Xylariaceae sp. FL1272]|nr:hypothetical protein GGR57DRAFT_513143 [Xylariaceae sp. FL1272]
MSSPSAQKAKLGAGVYTPLFLSFYERYVLWFNFPVLWRCDPDTFILPHFVDGFTLNHLDCGVADGYFPCRALQQSNSDSNHRSLTFLDLNINALEAARLECYRLEWMWTSTA